MGRSNAAHEPSMEEILASIRKIIESGEERPGDGATRPVASGFAPVASGFAPRASGPTGAEGLRETVADLRSATVPKRPDAAIVEAAAPASPASIATPDTLAPEATTPVDADDFFDLDFSDLKIELEQEFSAKTEAAEPGIVLAQKAPVVEPEPVAAAPVAPRQPEVRAPSSPDGDLRPQVSNESWMSRSDGRHAALRAAATVAVDRQAAAMPRSDTSSARPTAIPEAISQSVPLAAVFRPANSDDPRMNDYRAAVIEDAGRLPSTGGPQLLSERSGGLVGASFDELTRAIREGQLRSMEEMAEDLMRPMLQEWLDDNLPKLVERLVREEIERVARGGR